MFKEIKIQLTKLKDDLGLVIGFLTVCIGIVTNIIEIVNSTVYLTVLISGIFLISIRLCTKIKNAHRYSAGQKVYEYPDKSRVWAGRGLIASYVIAPLLIICIIGYKTIYQGYKNKDKIGVIITKFEDNKVDLFSNDLRLAISRNKQVMKDDKVKTLCHAEMLTTLPQDGTKMMQKLFDKYSFTKGLLVFGLRATDQISKENIFQCVVFVNNLRNLVIDTSEVNTDISDSTTLFIKNHQQFIDLGPDLQANQIAHFVLGLLHYNLGQFESAEQEFTTSIRSVNTSDKNVKRFVAQNYLYLGAGHVKEKKIAEAIHDYEKGIQSDSSISYLHYNLASLHLSQKDSIGAFRHYASASRLDKALSNPMNYFDPEKAFQNASVPKKATPSTDLVIKFNPLVQHHANNWMVSAIPIKKDSVNTEPEHISKIIYTFPQTCNKSLVYLTNEFQDSEILWLVMFNDNAKVPYYMTMENDLIIFNDEGKYAKVGRMVFTKNMMRQYRITDLCGNEWLTDGDENIISTKGKVGKAFPRSRDTY